VLVEAGFIEAMVDLLRATANDKVLTMGMEALEGCLVAYNKHHSKPLNDYNPFVEKMEEVGGLDRLEEIQTLDTITPQCYELAGNLVSKFWPDTGEDNYEQNDASEINDNVDFTFSATDDAQMMNKSGNEEYHF